MCDPVIILALYSKFVIFHFNRRHLLQDRDCTYNVTMRRIRETVIAVEKQRTDGRTDRHDEASSGFS
jgi:hypothetical protein